MYVWTNILLGTTNYPKYPQFLCHALGPIGPITDKQTMRWGGKQQFGHTARSLTNNIKRDKNLTKQARKT